MDQLYYVTEARVTCFSTFFISTVSCVLVLSRSSYIEYSIEITIWISGYQIIRKCTALVIYII